MFEALSDRFEGIFKGLRSRGKLTEKEVDEVLREIRLALLEADVNVGEVDVYSRSDSIGEIDLDTDVGGARLNVNGRRIDGDRGWVGESIRYDGDGDDDIEASSNVGDVSVRVGGG